MAEWSNAPVLKTGVLRGTGGSNPSLSAKEDSQSNKTLTFNKLGFFFYPIKSDIIGFLMLEFATGKFCKLRLKIIDRSN